MAKDASFDPVSSEFFRRHPEKLQVLAHPLRLKIMKQAQLREISAKEASADLHEPIGKVSYHVRVLADAGLLQLVRQTPRRGAIESHYKATVLLHLDDQTWDSLGQDVRRPLMTASVQEWSSDLINGVESGGFELEGSLLANAHLVVDEDGVDAVRDAVDAFYERLLEIEADVVARGVSGDPIEVNVGLSFYEGERTAAGNAPFFARCGGRAFPLIPEDT
ncbi:MAG: helix-turn-helix transcriptional regulator [Solirubrobacteraceae bacterium]|nr:helix-turn-helix transcriptional regulator [Solirubrobacteraceae bacterium]